MTKLAIVASHPIQHFCPLYRELADRIDLRVFFGSDAGMRPYHDPEFAQTISWGPEILDRFDHEFLPGAPGRSISESVPAVGLAEALARFRPDVVQSYGFRHGLSRAALLWARCHRALAVSIADSELRTPRSLLLRVRKAATVPVLLRLPQRFLTVGDHNEAYYRSYGVPQTRMHRSPFPIDTPALDEVLERRSDVWARRRSRWGASPDDVVLLVVGKLTARKSPLDVVRATESLLPEERKGIVVVFAGSGDQASAVRAEAQQAGVRCVMAGFLAEAELRECYAAADVLVHPSRQDPHPLAVAEAVYTGLPVVVSDRVGSVGPTDDVRLGMNGFDFAYGDVSALSGHLRAMLTPSIRTAMADESSRIGQERTLAISAATYLSGIGAY